VTAITGDTQVLISPFSITLPQVEFVAPTVSMVTSPPTVVTLSVVDSNVITPVLDANPNTSGLVAVPQPVAVMACPAWLSVSPAKSAPPPSKLAKLQGNAEIVTGVVTGVVVVPVVEQGSGLCCRTLVPLKMLCTAPFNTVTVAFV
jgi:hypothetical protein